MCWTAILVKKGQTFTTYADNQQGVLILVLKEECVTTDDGNSLGKFHFDGITPAPCGLPQVEVTLRERDLGRVHPGRVCTVSSSTQATIEIDSLFDGIDFSCCRKYSLRS